MHNTTKLAGNARVEKAIASKTLPKHFASNLKTIFAQSPGDPKSLVKQPASKRNATARRCNALLHKDSGSLIRFMIAYPPTVWEGGRTTRDSDFQRLLKASEPEPELIAAPFFQIISHELSATESHKTQRLIKAVAALNKYEDGQFVTSEALECHNPMQPVDSEERRENEHDLSAAVHPQTTLSSQSQIQSELQELLDDRRYVLCTGFSKTSPELLPSMIIDAMHSSNSWENGVGAFSSAVSLFAPRDPIVDDGFIVFPIGSQNVYTMVRALQPSM